MRKILIANRGEIACRAMRTAGRMGIATVAIYSEADRDALHVALADEAFFVGGASPAQSYLDIGRIVELCAQCGADGVYPGYGFLSENGDFADALEARGIAFIGPSAAAIRAMGDKITSRDTAQRAGVNVIPGCSDPIRDADHAVQLASGLGYPVMLKASKGGGGKGMRVAWNEDQCRDGFERARSEALSSFGDDVMFVEKYIDRPRHVEIQVLADRHGNCLYLHERECSVQRRHQKVIEEAPSAFIDAPTRKAMGEQAVALARAVGYYSAGTVEFIVDGERPPGPDNFYFLEMNTRLQVEHPVTEFITGLDLIELMIRVADGEALPLTQERVPLHGWAIEARVYAEDPYRGFLPSTGRLSAYRPASCGAHVRVDSGVGEGSEIGMFYDPMIAKLVAWDEDREKARARLCAALDEFHIQGVGNNLPFLASVVNNPRFIEARLSTAFIEEEYPHGFSRQPPDGEELPRFALVAALIHHRRAARAARISDTLPGHARAVDGRWVVFSGRDELEVEFADAVGAGEARVGGRALDIDGDWSPGQPLARVVIDGRADAFRVERDGNRYVLMNGGREAVLSVCAPREARYFRLMPEKSGADASRFLASPMPGLLVSLAVAEGDPVKAGMEIAVVEAMKMENTLRADRDGVVEKVHAAPGDALELDQPIVEFST